MPYADLDLLIADYIPEARKASEISAIGRILDGVSAFADTYCRRLPGYFNPAPTDPDDETVGLSMKRVRGEGTRYLRLPLHVFGSVTQVTSNFGTVLDPAAYYESDKNGWLHFETEFLSDTQFESFNRIFYEDRVFKVTARWGYAATPADLTEAVRLTVLRIWETQKGTLGQLTPGGFVVERAMAPIAKEILDRYKRREFEI